MKKVLVITALLGAIAATATYVILKSEKVKAILAKKRGEADVEEDPCENCENETCEGCEILEDAEECDDCEGCEGCEGCDACEISDETEEADDEE